VERLRGKDCVDRRSRERNVLRAALDELGPGQCTTRSRRISSAGSTARTRSNLGTSSRVSLPVPAPTSSTVAADPTSAASTASGGQPGRPRS
jgi:hypothetical protein